MAPLVPTALKPIWEIATNTNYMGYRIAKEPFTKEQEKKIPRSKLGKDNVSPAAKFFTDLLFRWGGGDNETKKYINSMSIEKEVPGIMDWNPSYVEHFIKGYTGGSGAVIVDLVTTAFQAIKPDQDIDFKNIPFVNKFIREVPEAKWNIINEYYALKELVSGHEDLKKEYEKQAEIGKGVEKFKQVMGAPYYEEYQNIYDLYDKQIKKASEVKGFDTINGSQYSIKLMQECIDKIKELNKKYKR
jgi:hypothetical protein